MSQEMILDFQLDFGFDKDLAYVSTSHVPPISFRV